MIHQHRYDVVIVGAGGAGMRASTAARMPAPAAPACGRGRGRSAGAHRGADQALPHPQPHRRRPGRDVRGVGQRRRRQLGMARLRHRQGRRLSRRPGRGGDHVPRSHRRGARPGEDGDAVQPHPEGRIDQRRFGGHTRDHGKARYADPVMPPTVPAR
ncbi:succinate dehydrogenase flavosubunit domain protein [Mycobacterium xenopi 4042]|uniref:Succinate dehydrogenase flavosubunit domain protein n=1 Tax=Mycobacterium xenopi 4042 TaxID=1299334 RepID=X7YKG4_MYCXE|nr:succinate dehydrogenase flavosubunit domain protein [Mycobacterium xenopi 4042]